MMNKWIVAAAMAIGLSAASARAADTLVFFGTHRSGPASGISAAHFDTVTGKLGTPVLKARADAAGYFVIAPDGRHLYAANALSEYNGQAHMGAVSAFNLDPKDGTLTLLIEVPSAGDDPAYIQLDKIGRFALVANYWGNHIPGQGGNLAAFAITPDGALGRRTAFVQHQGSGPDPKRQTQAFAHSINLDPSNRFALVGDLGLDKVFVYRFDAGTGALAPNDPPAVALKPGSGPRHTAFHPNGRFVYIVHEMAGLLTACRWDADKGTLTPIQEISTLPSDFHGTNTAAEVLVHPNGRFLYASNRGHDSIAEFSIDTDTGRLTMIGTVPSSGKTPRNFEIDPTHEWMIVTNHDSDNAVVFKIDPSTGKLTQQGEPVAVPNPFCPRFLPALP